MCVMQIGKVSYDVLDVEMYWQAYLHADFGRVRVRVEGKGGG